jgi:hypothetical protein
VSVPSRLGPFFSPSSSRWLLGYTRAMPPVPMQVRWRDPGDLQEQRQDRLTRYNCREYRQYPACDANVRDPVRLDSAPPIRHGQRKALRVPSRPYRAHKARIGAESGHHQKGPSREARFSSCAPSPRERRSGRWAVNAAKLHNQNKITSRRAEKNGLRRPSTPSESKKDSTFRRLIRHTCWHLF